MTVIEREPLTRQRVADAALALIDEQGIGALSMRKLGALLGVEAMSLYNHIDNKADLLRAVTSTLYAEVVGAYGEPDDDDWKVHARALSHAYVDVAARHPKAILLLIETPSDSVQQLDFVARVMAASRLMTDDIHAAALAFSVVGNWVVGTLVGRYGLLPRPDGEESLDGAVPEGYEEVARFQQETDLLSDTEKFDEGLEIILAGVEARYLSS